MSVDDEAKRLRAAVRRVNRARNFPHNTCPASRHVQMMGEQLAKGKPYLMLQEEPEHCAESLLAVVAALYEMRAKYEPPKEADDGR